MNRLFKTTSILLINIFFFAELSGISPAGEAPGNVFFKTKTLSPEIFVNKDNFEQIYSRLYETYAAVSLAPIRRQIEIMKLPDKNGLDDFGRGDEKGLIVSAYFKLLRQDFYNLDMSGMLDTAEKIMQLEGNQEKAVLRIDEQVLKLYKEVFNLKAETLNRYLLLLGKFYINMAQWLSELYSEENFNMDFNRDEAYFLQKEKTFRIIESWLLDAHSFFQEAKDVFPEGADVYYYLGQWYIKTPEIYHNYWGSQNTGADYIFVCSQGQEVVYGVRVSRMKGVGADLIHSALIKKNLGGKVLDPLWIDDFWGIIKNDIPGFYRRKFRTDILEKESLADKGRLIEQAI